MGQITTRSRPYLETFFLGPFLHFWSDLDAIRPKIKGVGVKIRKNIKKNSGGIQIWTCKFDSTWKTSDWDVLTKQQGILECTNAYADSHKRVHPGFPTPSFTRSLRERETQRMQPQHLPWAAIRFSNSCTILSTSGSLSVTHLYMYTHTNMYIYIYMRLGRRTDR